MWAAIVALATLAGAVFAWWISPQQVRTRFEKELEQLLKKAKELQYERDFALQTHDDNRLTIIDAQLSELRNRKAYLLQRLGQSVDSHK